jgi:oligopeptidase B
MRRWGSLLLPALFILAPAVALPTPASKTLDLARAALANPAPPLAARRPVRLSAHGIERVDPYAWLRASNWKQVLRDPSALAPEIRGYIEAENRYAEAVLAPLSGLRIKLVKEMKGRIEEEDSGVPAPSGGYAYWTKFLPGAEHESFTKCL